jgi:hypothetical protein
MANNLVVAKPWNDFFFLIWLCLFLYFKSIFKKNLKKLFFYFKLIVFKYFKIIYIKNNF